MSLAVRIASEFHQDVALQIQWYVRHSIRRADNGVNAATEHLTPHSPQPILPS